MANSIPRQERTVDPFASYNSNVVNNLTGIVTRGSNVLDYYNAVQVIPDSTSVTDHVEVVPGTVYKDDVMIDILASHRVDFTDPSQYVSASGDPLNTEPGIYYVVLEYTYTKSRPAPQARIKILLPSQRSGYIAGNLPSLLFLKAVEIEVTMGSGSIIGLYDYDQENNSIQREYILNYASNDIILPTFDQLRDQGRLTYVPSEDEFYVGYQNEWGSVGGGGAEFEANTVGFEAGDLVYLTGGGSLTKAISTLSVSTADGVISKVAVKGSVQTVGKVFDVSMEPGNNVLAGNLLYLSGTTPGTVTNQKTSPFSQFVGRCIAVDGTNADILFVRGAPDGIPSAKLSKFQYTVLDSTAGWIWDAGEALYYQDVDISTFDGKDVAVDLFNPSVLNRSFEPANIEFANDDFIRIWMPTIYEVVEVLILGKSTLTIGSSDVTTVTANLDPGGWIWDATNSEYYQTIDVSDIKDGKGIVNVYDHILHELIEPHNTYLWDSTTVTIAMPGDLSTLGVTIIGDSNVGTSTNVTFTTILAAGSSWNPLDFSYYQDIDIGELGISTEALVFGSSDFDTGMKIFPYKIAFLSETLIRVWMADDTVSVAVTING